MDFCITDSEEIVVKKTENTTEEFFRKNYVTFIDFETFYKQYKTSMDNCDSFLNKSRLFSLELSQNIILYTPIVEDGVKLR